MIQLGKKNTLRVSRESEFGLFLKDERDTEVLLPNAYVKEWMKVGKEVDVFIYHDSEDRLTATTVMPKAMLDEFGFFEVVDVAYFGAFVDWGLPKDLLVPKQFQKEPFRIGEKKFLRVVYDEKTHRLVATERITKYLDHNPKGLRTNQELKALIIKKTDLGYKCIVDDKYEGLLYHNEVFEKLQVGDIKKVYLKKRRHDGFLDLSLKKLGAKGAISSQEKILHLLKEHKNHLPYTSKSDADEIREFFEMSKKEFKKTLTLLQEKKKIFVDEKGIHLL
ncbi:MAG: DNA-binding protein [Epsilonproteobacteria bacterium]|nr:DNA-binding protein [Campylobacterota bacterium]